MDIPPSRKHIHDLWAKLGIDRPSGYSKFEGTITEICKDEFCRFEVDGEFKVCAARMVAFKDKIPSLKVGQTIKVQKAHVTGWIPTHDLHLCEESVIEVMGDHCFITHCTKLLAVIKKYNLGYKDIDKLRKIWNELQSVFADNTCNLFHEFFSALNENLPLQAGEPMHGCFQHVLEHFSILLDCWFVEKRTTKEGAPFWKYGIHGATREAEWLMGALCIKDNQLCLVGDYQTPYVPATMIGGRLIEFINKLILIKKYLVCSEVYSEGIGNYVSVAFKHSDVIPLGFDLMHMTQVNYAEGGSPQIYKNKLEFILIAKTGVMFVCDNTFECWLRVLINNCDQYLCIRKSLLFIHFLKVGHKYMMYYNDTLIKGDIHPEIKRISVLPTQILCDPDVFFVLDIEIPCIETKWISPDCIQTSTDKWLNIEAVIEEHDFGYKTSSRSVIPGTPRNYGTPGNRDHILKLAKLNGGSVKFYINNWEIHQTPHFLVPEMRIRIRYATKKGNYGKCTAMTSFEIVRYEPKVLFESAAWRDGQLLCDRSDLLHCNIPHGVAVLCKVVTLEIQSFKASSTELTVTLLVNNVALVVVKMHEIIAVILGITLEVWMKIYNCVMKTYPLYIYRKNPGGSATLLHLDNMIDAINQLKVQQRLYLHCESLWCQQESRWIAQKAIRK